MDLDESRAKLSELSAPYRRSARWAAVPAELDRAIELDHELTRTARDVRVRMLPRLRSLGVAVPDALQAAFARAFVDVPRERFVLPDDIATSADDTPQLLDRQGAATVSAPHAYLLTFALLDLGPGDRLLELGTGTGYGAALARRIVGETGFVASVEIDGELHARAARLLRARGASGEADVELARGDGAEIGPAFIARTSCNKVGVTYAMLRDPEALVAALPEAGVLVAPVSARPDVTADGPELRGARHQQIVRFVRRGGGFARSTHGAVLYVPERHRL